MGEEGCGVLQIPIILPPPPPSGPKESPRALTAGHPSPMASLRPVYTLLSHCDSLDSDSTACTHNVFIGHGCMWHFNPLRVPRAPEHHRLGGGGPGWTMRSSLQGTMRRQSGGTKEEGRMKAKPSD